MDVSRFDKLSRALALTASRRTLLGGTLAAIAGWLSTPRLDAKKRRRKRKPRLNQFGCINVGDRCDGNRDRCCSGLCKGKKGKKRCRAHDTGGCLAGQTPIVCGGSENVTCTASNGALGQCLTTTGQAGSCANLIVCEECTTDPECQALFGNDSACVLCLATCTTTGGRGCTSASPLADRPNQAALTSE